MNEEDEENITMVNKKIIIFHFENYSTNDL